MSNLLTIKFISGLRFQEVSQNEMTLYQKKNVDTTLLMCEIEYGNEITPVKLDYNIRSFGH
jgi:hypothetical protein